MTAAADLRWMRAALTLARRGLGRVWPNPAVGCVVVKDGRVLGRGWTQPGGRPHAETMALAQAGAAAHGATAYVSLEPCAHHGRTPPCADALVAAGVARVVAPMTDPDPRVSGRGFAALRAAGVEVALAVLAEEAAALNAGFLSLQRRGRPFLTLKLAASLDGRIAARTGESRWITGPEARRRVHLMRAESDAIMVGAGTARTDDPMLDVRLEGLEARSPLRVVLDADLSLPDTSRLATSRDAAPVLRVCREGAATDGAWGHVAACSVDGSGRFDLTSLLEILGARGVTRVLSEGGGRMAASLLQARLVDELIVASAGVAIGGDGAAAIGPLGLDALDDAPRFDMVAAERVGADLFTTWRPRAVS